MVLLSDSVRETFHPHNCGELYRAGYEESGVYNVYIFSAGQPVPVPVYCDMDTDRGGWLVSWFSGNTVKSKAAIYVPDKQNTVLDPII